MRKILIILILPAVCLALVLNGWAIAKDDKNPEEIFLSGIRQITFEGRRAGEGYFSSDGTKLVFQSEREPGNPFYQIYLLDLETGDTMRISPGIGKTTCSWIHPDGNKVLFASTHADPDAVKKQEEELELRASGRQRRYAWDYDTYFDLWEYELGSGKYRQLTREKGYDAEGSWSPDGRLIAFASNRQAYERPLTDREQEIFETDISYLTEIYIMNSDGTGVRRLTDVPGYDGGPFFSPDGKRICWRRFSEDGATAEIFTMNIDGTDQKQLTRLGAMSWAPYFHPSGEYLAFATNLHGFANFEVYLVDAEGETDPVRITNTDGFDGLPVFSPDGGTLAWTSNRSSDGSSQIFFAKWNHEAALKALAAGRGVRTSPAITVSDLRRHVDKLASEQLEGRMTGSEGERLAAAYLAEYLKALGLEPTVADGTYRQPFEFTAGVDLGPDNRLRAGIADSEPIRFELNRDWRPVAFSKTGNFEKAGIVFAGYGIAAPAEMDFEEYDSYAHLDVTDKWVLMFRYLPENVTPERRQHLARYSGLRFKAMAARDRGARGVLIVSGPSSRVEKQLIDLSFDSSLGTTSVAVLSISDDLAARILAGSGKELGKLQTGLDSGELSAGFELEDTWIEAAVDIRRRKKNGVNVLARLNAGENPSDRPALLLGAHYDHLGRGVGITTLAKKDEKGMIHYGADDNASGVSGLLEIAEYLVDLKKSGKLPMKRDLIVTFWSGEELGLLGSSHFAKQLATEIRDEGDLSSRIAAYINLDMIGRLQKDLIIQGIGSSPLWKSEIERRNAPVGLSIVTQNDSYLPTDATSFYLKRVPILAAFTGTHADYHSPRDTADKLNYEGMVDISRLTALIARSLLISDKEPDYVEMERPAGGGRARLRAYMGTIPDYAQGDVAGVQLSGVISGGPAEKAGLKGGDIIVEVAGRKIENIYDYTYAIEALKIGEPVRIVVLRNGKRLTFEATPGSRE